MEDIPGNHLSWSNPPSTAPRSLWCHNSGGSVLLLLAWNSCHNVCLALWSTWVTMGMRQCPGWQGRGFRKVSTVGTTRDGGAMHCIVICSPQHQQQVTEGNPPDVPPLIIIWVPMCDSKGSVEPLERQHSRTL